VAERAGGDLNAALRGMDDVAWARQVHGAAVLIVDAPGCAGEADALVTASPGLRLAVRAADCGTLVLAAPEGSPRPCVGVVHAGWRGTRDGVVAAASKATLLMMGLSERWNQEGLGETRRAIARAAPAPMVFVRRGTRPGALAPHRTCPASPGARLSWPPRVLSA